MVCQNYLLANGPVYSYKGQDILDVFLAGQKEFDKLYRSSEQKKDRIITIRGASLKDITNMKKRSGRPLGLADIELIKEVEKHKKY